MLGVHDSIFPAVAGKDRKLMQRDRTHGMQLAGDEHVFALASPVGVAVAVIIVYAEAEDEAHAVPIARGDRVAGEELVERVAAVLEVEHEALVDAPGAEPPVAGGEEQRGILRQGAQLRPDPAAEKVVEAGEAPLSIVLQPDPVASDEGADQRPGEGGVHKAPGEAGDRPPGQQLQRGAPRRRAVQEAQSCALLLRGFPAAVHLKITFHSSSRRNSSAPRPTMIRMPRRPGFFSRKGTRNSAPVSSAAQI